jgi:hypothetical protein
VRESGDGIRKYAIDYGDRKFTHDPKFVKWRKEFEARYNPMTPAARIDALLKAATSMEVGAPASLSTEESEFKWMLTVGTISNSVYGVGYWSNHIAKLRALDGSSDYEVLRARWLFDRCHAYGEFKKFAAMGERILAVQPNDYWFLQAMATAQSVYVGGDQDKGLSHAKLFKQLYPNDPWSEYRLGQSHNYRLIIMGRKSDLDGALTHYRLYLPNAKDPKSEIERVRRTVTALETKGATFVKKPNE